MRGHDDGRAFGIDVQKQLDQFFGSLRVQLARWLVGKEDQRIVDDRTRHCHALLLAAGKLHYVVVFTACQPYALQHGRHALANLRPGPLHRFQRKGDIVENRAFFHQPEILEDNAGIAAQTYHLGTGKTDDAAAADQDLPGGGRLFAEEEADQRGFACAGSTGEKDEFAEINRKIDI